MPLFKAVGIFLSGLKAICSMTLGNVGPRGASAVPAALRRESGHTAHPGSYE